MIRGVVPARGEARVKESRACVMERALSWPRSEEWSHIGFQIVPGVFIAASLARIGIFED